MGTSEQLACFETGAVEIHDRQWLVSGYRSSSGKDIDPLAGAGRLACREHDGPLDVWTPEKNWCGVPHTFSETREQPETTVT